MRRDAICPCFVARNGLSATKNQPAFVFTVITSRISDFVSTSKMRVRGMPEALSMTTPIK
jgi:hypothetical protein